MAQSKLIELAKVVRSKNAGPFELTFDIMFDDPAEYERVKKSGVINAHRIAEIYRVQPSDLRAANPNVNFDRLKAGDQVNVPLNLIFPFLPQQ